jgi:hypothetical protein
LEVTEMARPEEFEINGRVFWRLPRIARAIGRCHKTARDLAKRPDGYRAYEHGRELISTPQDVEAYLLSRPRNPPPVRGRRRWR